MRFYHTSDQLQYRTGGQYQGEWKYDKKHGYGVKSWVSGNKYEGVSGTEYLRVLHYKSSATAEKFLWSINVHLHLAWNISLCCRCPLDSGLCLSRTEIGAPIIQMSKRE